MYLKTGLRFVGIEVGNFDASAQASVQARACVLTCKSVCAHTHAHVCVYKQSRLHMSHTKKFVLSNNKRSDSIPCYYFL